ncbi:MAG: hypothetical protein HY825_02290 [Acidobacteria bacterium]|nr:hypothetical protein [Acidobacteriota bacterium]
MSDERDAATELDALERAGRLAEAASKARELAERAPEPAARALALVRAAELLLETQGPPAARPLLDEALADARRAGDGGAEALALAETARLELFGRDTEALHRAEKLLDEAAARAGLPDPGQGLPAAAACRIAHYRGLLASRRGEPATSVAQLRRAYALADGDPAQRSRILNSWGLQLEAWGDADEARRLLERSLELKLELQDLYGAAATYGALAFLHSRLGAHAEARDALARDLELSERIGALDVLPGLHARLAGALVGLGRIGGAEREARTAIELAETSSSVPATRARWFAWRELARVRLAQGLLDEAREAARERALAGFEALRDPYGSALARLTLAEVELLRGEGDVPGALAAAQEALDGARAVFARLGAVQETAEALLLQARIERARGETDRAAATAEHRVLPLVERLARATPHLRRAALDLLAATRAGAADERLEVLAGLRRVETMLADRAGAPAAWTAVAVAVGTVESAERAARAAAAEGGVLAWFPPRRAVALFAGPDAAARAEAMRGRMPGVATAVVSGEATVRALWPAGPTAEGPAVDEALRGLPRGRKRKPPMDTDRHR